MDSGLTRSVRRPAIPSSIADAPISRARRTYALIMFSLVSMLAVVDRHVLSVLVAPIQQELNVNDTAMGLLSGVAFALFYAIAAIPVARYADRGNRRNLLAVALTVWSAATVMCGVAASYAQLLLARIGVAAGESAANPTMMSLIGSMYPRDGRASAIGVMFAGSAIGMFLGSALAGLLNDLYGWRVAFMAIGAPGILLALVICLSVPEPRRAVDDAVRGTEAQEPVSSVLRYLLSIRTFLPLLVAKCFFNMAFFSFLAWVPTLLIRSHQMTTAQMGLLFGTAFGIGGLLSNLAGGMASDRLARRGTRWYMYFCSTASCIAIPSLIAILWAQSSAFIFAGCLCFAVTGGLTVGPSLAAGLAVVRPQTHAFMTAVMYFCMNLVGAGLGPLLIGAASDAIRPTFGDHSLKFALTIIAVELSIAAWMFFRASRVIERDASGSA